MGREVCEKLSSLILKYILIASVLLPSGILTFSPATKFVVPMHKSLPGDEKAIEESALNLLVVKAPRYASGGISITSASEVDTQ